MKHVLVIKKEEGGYLSLVNDQNGNIAWFYGHILNEVLTFKRASTPSEFAKKKRDDRYEPIYTEKHVEMPTAWKVLMQYNNTLRLMRSVGKKTELANLEISMGNNELTDIVKDIDAKSIKTQPGATLRFFYDGKFRHTVAEMLPGFKKIRA